MLRRTDLSPRELKLAHSHSLLKNIIFGCKAELLSLKRYLSDRKNGRPKRYEPCSDSLPEVQLLASSSSALWRAMSVSIGGENEHNLLLTAGKIQNLRVAARALDGITLGANEVFSFWRQLGRPSACRGYVVGRELREGCIIPVVAGGLCQLSNALYDAARQAGLEIIERHRHSSVVAGSMAEQDRDATVKWNYIDLRFKSAEPVHLSVKMTANELVVSFYGTKQKERVEIKPQQLRAPHVVNDCYSCGRYDCHTFSPKHFESTTQMETAYLLDAYTPEFDAYVQEQLRKTEGIHALHAPMPSEFLGPRANYKWTSTGFARRHYLSLLTLWHSWRVRHLPVQGAAMQSALWARNASLALAMAKALPVTVNHVVVSQNLLPFLWKNHALGGRSFDVLMVRPPLAHLQKTLDEAAQANPQGKTLTDFRIDEDWVRVESEALRHARKVVSPHSEVVSLFPEKSVTLDWREVDCAAYQALPLGRKVLFPASTLARKGAYHVRSAAQRFGWSLVITGAVIEAEDFWAGIACERRAYAAANLFEDVGLVFLPAYVEAQPLVLLHAAARGIPVLASAACGLERVAGVSTFHDEAQLQALLLKMNPKQNTDAIQ